MSLTNEGLSFMPWKELGKASFPQHGSRNYKKQNVAFSFHEAILEVYLHSKFGTGSGQSQSSCQSHGHGVFPASQSSIKCSGNEEDSDKKL